MSAAPQSIERVIEAYRAGRMVIMLDDAERENEGDFMVAAECATAELINQMARDGRGLICLTLTPDRCRQLGLSPMTQHNRTRFGTNFTVSVEAAQGVTTGISVPDRLRTIQAAVNRQARPEDLVSPGHMFPIQADPGGVLARPGHTEAGVDLARLCGFEPASVICEILSEDGSMARLPELLAYAEKHDMPLGTIADLRRWLGDNGATLF